ncbi:MAG: LON peptidase substrate-binding domain-containing protein [Planctomycetia bacterium]|nr:LON peptidase substrate-binding domain-containing protein [Planctomycetia bacterium]
MADAPLDLEKLLLEFSGEVPVFPLPSLVLLPDALAPLHIFEDRYRKMVADALEGERLIAMALLQPGWEPQYAGAPPFHERVCVGTIVNHEQLPDGRYRLLLYGLFRAKVVAEISSEPYRRVAVEVPAETLDVTRAAELDASVHALLDRLPGRRGPIGQLRTLAAKFRGTPGGPGSLVDAAAEAADLPPEDRYALLAEDDVLARAALLLDALDRKARGGDESLPPRSDPRLN